MKKISLYFFIFLLLINGSSIAEPISDVFQYDTIGQSNGSDYFPNIDTFRNHRSLHGFEDPIQYTQWILKNKKERLGLNEERLDKRHISNGGVAEAFSQNVQILSGFESSDLSSPKVTEFFPDNGYNSAVSQSVTIVGSGFVPGISANITNGTYRQRNITSIIFICSEEITATFNLQKLIPGKYWIDVTNPDGISSPKNFNLTWGSYGEPRLSFPYGTAVDSSGFVYITDTGNDRIQKFDSSGNYVTSWGTSGSDPGQFNEPVGIAVDSSGFVYVVDSENSRIQKFDSSGNYVTSWGTSGSAPGQFNRPIGIAVDSSGFVYVADILNNRIQKFDSSGNYVTSWGSSGSESGHFNVPRGIAIDSSCFVYVADTGNDRIQKFDSSGNYVTSWGTSGSAPGQFNRPIGIAVDSSGFVYVADILNNRIQKFDSSGNYVTSWGTSGSAPGQFIYPSGIAVDSSGFVYVADSWNSRIQKFDSSGNYVTSLDSSGSEPGLFNWPVGIAVDSSGFVYVTDSGNSRIQKFDSSGNYVLIWDFSGYGFNQFYFPGGIAVDSSGFVYVADLHNDRIKKFDSSGNYVSIWGSSGFEPGQFNAPYGIAVDSSSNIYVADTENNRIQKFDSSGNYVSSWGWSGSEPGLFNWPVGIAVDSSGFVYVADSGNSRIQKFDSSGNYESSWGSSGSAPGQLNSPVGIAVDSSGFVYVTDSGNSRIQKFDSSGNYVSSWGSSGSESGQFNEPVGIAVDSSSNIYVADTENNRIQKFSDAPFTVKISLFPPYVDSISPTSGQAGGDVQYTLTGSNFQTGAIVNLTRPGQNNLTSTGRLSGSEFTGQITLPVSAATGFWNVSVNQGGLFSNDNVQFTITAAPVVPPHVNSIVPPSGQVGSDVQYTLTGSNFQTGAIVNLTRPGQNNLTSTGRLSGSEFTGQIMLPVSAATGLWNVSVNQGGLFSNDNVQFTITAAPVIPPHVNSIVPPSGQVGSDIHYTLTGSNFQTGAIVNLTRPGQTNLTSTGTLSGNGLTGQIWLPVSAATGLWNVSVNQGGLFSNDNVQFTITAAPVQKPVIHNLNPGGVLYQSQSTPFPVTITGTGFDTVDPMNGVTLDGSPIEYTLLSSTRIDAQFPETVDEVLGNHPVIVTGVTGSSDPYNFVVSAGGFTITTISDSIGWINPSGPIYNVPAGSSKTFTFKPTAGAMIKNVTVNGNEVSLSSEMTYTIGNVDRNYEVRLNCKPLPGVIIPAFSVTYLGGNSVRFTDASLGSPNTWKWDFGDKEHGDGSSVEHAYAEPGVYSVSMWARNDFSQSQVVMGNIEVPMSNTQDSVYIY